MKISKEVIEKIKSMYEEGKMGVPEISEQLGLSISFIYYNMKKEKIKRRGFSESQTDSVKNKIKKTCIKKYGSEHFLGSTICLDKTRATNMVKYGVEYTLQSQEVKQRIKQTNIKKYGCENPLCNSDIKNKIKKTNIERYGVENVFQSKEIKEKIEQTNLNKYGSKTPMSSDKIKNKIKKTNIERYGVENVSSNNDIKEQKKKTCMKNFGVTYPMQSEEVQKKSIKTCLEKYGTKNAVQNVGIRDRIKNTMQKRYGCDYPYQNEDIFQKSVANSFKFRKYTMPSGKEIYIQGYEDIMLNMLLKEHDESQISVHRDVPSIKWKDKMGINRIHYPDIYIKNINKIIEVKSIWTYKKNQELIFEKQAEAIKQGFLYTIYVLKKNTKNEEKGEILYEI